MLKINFRTAPSIFFEPAAAIATLVLWRAAQETRTEISAQYCIIPCDEDLNLQEKGNNIPYMLTKKHPHLIVLGGEFPEQVCSSVETKFQTSDSNEKLKTALQAAYPTLHVPSSNKIWTHNHPGSVMPSGTDENTVDGMMSLGSLYYIMMIINSNFGKTMSPNDLYIRLMLNTNTVRPNIRKNADGLFVWDGEDIVFDTNPTISRIDIGNTPEGQELEVVGHYPMYWMATHRTIYRDIMSKNPSKNGYEVYNNTGDVSIPIPSVSTVCSRVNVPKAKNEIGFKQTPKEEKTYKKIDFFDERNWRI